MAFNYDNLNNYSYIRYINKESDLYLVEYNSYLRSLKLTPFLSIAKIK